ncbi:hypothetical protein PoB_006297900 [Plakobranchus ocellatus]|uniref:Uncharacterized protein n=1 Tax=Plakobranchus ocellatus TaxID=259542 RepID=A0AAV4CX53_9GAST|nr:hypothetical protein PoB_006297900 [Plakobranchus ocellatus]
MFPGSSEETEWFTVLVATSSTTSSVNISDLYFNRLGKFETSDQFFANTRNLSSLLQDRSEYRSCLIDAWVKVRYYENNPDSRCSDEELIEVYSCWAVGGTVASESALRSAGTLLSAFRAPPSAPELTEGLKV